MCYLLVVLWKAFCEQWPRFSSIVRQGRLSQVGHWDKRCHQRGGGECLKTKFERERWNLEFVSKEVFWNKKRLIYSSDIRNILWSGGSPHLLQVDPPFSPCSPLTSLKFTPPSCYNKWKFFRSGKKFHCWIMIMWTRLCLIQSKIDRKDANDGNVQARRQELKGHGFKSQCRRWILCPKMSSKAYFYDTYLACLCM